LELIQRLEETTSHRHFVKEDADPKFYLSLPECMHAFYIDKNSQKAKQVWSFAEKATRIQNSDARKLWARPLPGEEMQKLLDRYVYEFMMGYEGTVNLYTSETGQQLKSFTREANPLQEVVSQSEEESDSDLESEPRQSPS
jgi:hypothetical protein